MNAFLCPTTLQLHMSHYCSDGLVHEWDIATGACVRMLKGHSRPLTALWVSQTDYCVFIHVCL